MHLLEAASTKNVKITERKSGRNSRFFVYMFDNKYVMNCEYIYGWCGIVTSYNGTDIDFNSDDIFETFGTVGTLKHTGYIFFQTKKPLSYYKIMSRIYNLKPDETIITKVIFT